MSTPINDKFTEFMKGADDATHLVALDLLSRELERKLAVARTALKTIQSRVTGECFPNWDNHSKTFRSRDFIADICEHTLSITEP
jgi:hypothetical protein